MTMPVQIPPPPTGQPSALVSLSTTSPNAPTFACKAHREQLPRWNFCLDMLGGTDYIRTRGEQYNPKMPAESQGDYDKRLQRSDFFSMFEETCGGLTGMVLRKPIDFEDETPEALTDLAEDIDGMGTGLNIWARRFLFDSIARGHMGLLVDYPEVDGNPSLGERRDEYKMRAYFCMVAPENILNWRTTVEYGRLVLTLLTLREIVQRPLGDFGEEFITRYRVYRRERVADTGQVTVEVWESDAQGKKVRLVTPSRPVTPCTTIPFAVHYSGATLGYLYSKPPLLELAFTNIAHYQMQSDYRNSLHISSAPILVTKGLRRRAGGATQAVGAAIGMECGKDGDIKYVEHTGAALGSARIAIQDVEARAAALGLAMLKREARTAETLGAVKLDKSEQASKLALAAKNLEDVLEVAFGYAAEFMAVEYETEVVVNQDFSDLTFDPDMIRALNELVAAGNLTRETMWDLLIRGGTLPDSFDAKGEAKSLDKQENAALLQQVKDAAAARAAAGPGAVPGTKPSLTLQPGGKAPAPAPKPMAKAAAR